MQDTKVNDVVRALLALPPERVAEVYDFILFLQDRYGLVADVSDAWTEEDVNDLVSDSLTHASDTFWTDEESDDSTR